MLPSFAASPSSSAPSSTVSFGQLFPHPTLPLRFMNSTIATLKNSGLSPSFPLLSCVALRWGDGFII